MQLAVLLVGMALAVIPLDDPNARVHDFARLLKPEDRASLEALARDVERETTAQIAVVTVPSLRGMSVDGYANQLFNEWGIGDKKYNNGVLFLIAPTERRMRIEVGYGLEPLLTDDLCGEIRDQQVIPRFKANDMPGGIMAGARRIASILRDNRAAAQGVPNSGPLLAKTKRGDALIAISAVTAAALLLFGLGLLIKQIRLYSPVVFFAISLIVIGLVACAAFALYRASPRERPLGLFGGAAAASVLAWGLNFGRYRRFGPHGCSKCGTQLELLGEQDDDPKLEPVQRLEEQIGSVDYDVWICPACLNQDTERYIKSFSSFRECPRCHGITFKQNPMEVVLAPTTANTGTGRVEGRCVFCNHKTVQTILLPMIVQSSTSSSRGGFGGGGFSGGGGGGGGGFGGGSSGGGGASGGW